MAAAKTETDADSSIMETNKWNTRDDKAEVEIKTDTIEIAIENDAIEIGDDKTEVKVKTKTIKIRDGETEERANNIPESKMKKKNES